ncbi:MAG TPA: hypothetical protein VHS34_09040 [Terriglobales bacterium]|nr:hypothetical protein [Terriglobales bacterium]
MKTASRADNSGAAAPIPIAETTGEVFPNGDMIELVASAPGEQPNLLLWDGETRFIAPQVEYGGRTYQAQELHGSVLGAMRLPPGAVDYGTTLQLFTELRDAFEKYLGFSANLAGLSAFWVLTTWFSDCLLNPPSLWVSGSDIDGAAGFLALLSCICRHGIRLTGVAKAGFLSLPLSFQPTLLVHQPSLRPELRSLWCESNYRGFVVPGGSRGKVRDATCSKAVFWGMFGFAPPPSAGNIQIALFPPDHILPLLDDRVLNDIANHFQPRLLQYRLDHARQVRESRFVAPDLRFPICDLARALGACIQGDPNLALQVVPLLRSQEDLIDRCDLNHALVEVLWPRVHQSARATVGIKIGAELTPEVNTFLLTCGETRQYGSEEVGARAAKLGLTKKRTNTAALLVLDRKTSRRIHQLAQSYGIKKSVPGCPDCQPAETPVE